MQTKIKSFRTEMNLFLQPLIKISAGFGLVVLAIGISNDGLENMAHTVEKVLLALSVMVPFLSLLFLYFTFRYKITIYSDGIKSFDPYKSEVWDFMEWSSMHQIKRKKILGAEYYLIESQDEKMRLWIPSRIKDKAEFMHLVQKFAGKTNILYREGVEEGY